ncbi:hypothetical protein Dsin_005611 [Dipteronia sinensis]|uniref:Uncharacterized protein n=1 Tax=Dipteronia sinensis TaxID=43782 RepID=A0AAE0AY38_9ROSI|nr:hypothetical protein Dsin_005611 [Dipteronia sinensis]
MPLIQVNLLVHLLHQIFVWWIEILSSSSIIAYFYIKSQRGIQMGKPSTIFEYFSRTKASDASTSNVNALDFENQPIKSPRINVNEVGNDFLVLDMGQRPRIWDYRVNKHDEIQRA